MKSYISRFRLVFAVVLSALLVSAIAARETVVKSTQTLMLGETPVKINVYEKQGMPITFFAPHFNEQTGTAIVKEFIAKSGGRLIEIESIDDSLQPARFLKFKQLENFYTVDPNRIFTDNGRLCSQPAPDANSAVKTFAGELLKIIFPANGKLRQGERFLVAVHNNKDVDDAAKTDQERVLDLTAYAFARNGKTSAEIFYAQADGVYLSNNEFDADNFVFLTSTQFLDFFAEKGFNVVVQKSAARLQDKSCRVDDGSLSVFAAQQKIPYINIEADAANGGFRQRQMILSVYELMNVYAGRQASRVAETGEAEK